MRFRYYKPGWADIELPEPVEVKDIQEVIQTLGGGEGVVYSQSQVHDSSVYYLMATLPDQSFWVRGFCDQDMGLPTWKYPGKKG